MFMKIAAAAVLAALSASAAGDSGSERSFGTFVDWLSQRADAPVDGLAPGTYGVDRLDDFESYLPPGYFERFRFDALALELIETRPYEPHSSYREATARFVDDASLAEDGRLVGYTAGRPFPHATIAGAAADKAGFMVAWNQIHRWQYYGSRVKEALISYIQPMADGATGGLLEGMEGGGHVDRYLSMQYHRVYLSGLAVLPEQGYRMDVDGSDRLLFKEYIELMSPFDVAGTKLVVERPLDQALGDQVNSYLPSERRVRRLSAKERADSWMGTNWTLDDFEGFSGLVMDSTWSLLGRKVIPYVANSGHERARYHGPLSTIPLDRWQLRRCYVVEAKPLWEGHPYGRRVLFIDEETFSIGLVLIFDRAEWLAKVLSVVWAHSDNPDEASPGTSVPRWRSSIVMNLDDGTANIARGMKPTEFIAVKPSQVRKIFSVSNLTSGR